MCRIEESINLLSLKKSLLLRLRKNKYFHSALSKMQIPLALNIFPFFYWGSHVTIWPQWVLRVVPQPWGKHEYVWRAKTRQLVSCGGEGSADILHFDTAKLLLKLLYMLVCFAVLQRERDIEIDTESIYTTTNIQCNPCTFIHE